MATNSNSHPEDSNVSGELGGNDSMIKARKDSSIGWRILSCLASLKITVTLFALSMFLVLIGTLAQATEGIWIVIDDYFRSFTVFIPFKAFLPPAWFPNFDVQEYLQEKNFPISGIWFVGGKSLGVALMINLIAAHIARFKVRGTQSAIVTGIGFIAFGLVLTAVIVGGSSYADGVQDEPLVSYGLIWRTMLSANVAIFCGLLGMLFFLESGRSLERILIVVGLLLTLAGGGGLYVLRDMADQMESAMRIVWQLAQATIVGCVLLTGCAMVFRNKGGIVLLHFGIGLMMLNELFVGMYAVEEKITCAEKQTVEYAYNTQSVELAVTHRGEERDTIVSIPTNKLQSGNRISHPELPFDLLVNAYFPNSNIVMKESPDAEDTIPMKGKTETIRPTRGRGRFSRAVNIARYTGADVNQKVDMASAYVSIFEKGESEPLDVVLLSQHFSDLASTGRDDGANSERIKLDSKVFELALRFERVKKPYRLSLIDVRAEQHVGSTKARSFASDFRIQDKASGETQTASISMNNPLRYKGETFYQAGYFPQRGSNGRVTEVSTFQVVTNQSWMIPYIGCMYVVIGLLAQFGAGLLKFAERVQKKKTDARRQSTGKASDDTSQLRSIEAETAKDLTARLIEEPGAKSSLPAIAWIIPSVVMILAVVTSYSLTFSGKAKTGEFDIRAAGTIPVSAGGRFQPMDTFGRVLLRRFSDYESVSLTDEQQEAEVKGGRKRIYATEWLLDVLTNPELADEEYRIFRIYDPFLLRKLDLETKRKGYTYTYNEVSHAIDEFNEYAEEALRLRDRNNGKVDELSFQQRKSITLYSRIREYERFRNASLVLNPRDPKSVERVINDSIIFNRGKAPLKTDGNIIELIDSIVERSLAEDRASEINYLAYLYGFVRSGQGSIVKGQANSPMLAPYVPPADVVVGNAQARLALPLGKAKQALGKEKQGVQVGSIVLQSNDNSRWKLISDVRLRSGSPSGELDWQKLPGVEVLTLSTVRQTLIQFAQRENVKSLDELVVKLVEMDPSVQQLRQRPDEFLSEIRDRSISLYDEYADIIKEKLRETRNDPPASILEACKKTIEESYTNQKSNELLEIRQIYSRYVGAIFDENLSYAPGPESEFNELLLAYRDGEVESFNSLVESYTEAFAEFDLPEFSQWKLSLEHFYHFSAPLFQALIFYGVAALFVVIAWVLYAGSLEGFGAGVQRSAVGVLALGGLLHTVGIVERILITGKAPVTNLYASAVFISWGSVMCGFVIDLIIRFAAPKATRIGFGTLLGSLMGFVVILVSYNLALRDDTFGKLEAVLDTQFWLATHVVCVTSGYVATFVAGVLGLFFLIGAGFTPIFDKEIRRGVSWIIYGIVCFALLLSFFGTVLGGLWADDSWGRFWGWDPKENGALLIVIWNALILHARWGGMIRERGLAILAIIGNVVTCWSWFGVNELGVGLHSYGFTEGVLATLGYVAGAHLLIVIIASVVPVSAWRSYRAETASDNSTSNAVRETNTRKKRPKNPSKKSK